MPIKAERGRLYLGFRASGLNEENLAEWLDMENTDFVILPLVAANSKDVGGADFEALIRSDLAIDSYTWQNRVVLEVHERVFMNIVDDMGAGLLSQIRWGLHCCCRGVLIPVNDWILNDQTMMNLCNVLNTLSNSQTAIMLKIRTSYSRGISGWEVYDKIKRVVSMQNSNPSVCLEIVGGDFDKIGELVRWKSENVAVLLLSKSIVKWTITGKLALTNLHGDYVSSMIFHGASVCLNLEDKFEDLNLDYFKYLWTSQPHLTPNEQNRLNYRDVLQIPLQPLADDLDKGTYECFESDPVKYDLYYQAINKFFAGRWDTIIKQDTKIIRIALLGGGRGPIMDKILDAIALLDCAEEDFELTVVEKNPHATRTLQHKCLVNPRWRNHRVQIVKDDMRNWKPQHPVDLVVSELLGSFGDNELSPECLDPVMLNLKSTGVSIPTRYYSSLIPISSSKLWDSVQELKLPQSSFVVELFSYHTFTLQQPLKCFDFIHSPSQEVKRDNLHNQRYSEVGGGGGDIFGCS